jgi:type III secretion system needle length determinant
MATMIANATEAASRSPQSQAEPSRSGSSSAAGRDVASDAQAFTAALQGEPASADKTLAGSPVKQMDKALLPERQAAIQRGEKPDARPVDVFRDALPLGLPLPEPLVGTLRNSMGVALPPAGKDPSAASSREASAAPPTPTSAVSDSSEAPLPSRAAPNAQTTLSATSDREPTRRATDSKTADDKTDPNPTATLALGDSILRGLQGKSEPEPAAVGSPAVSESNLSEIVEKVAARILVADRSTGAPEVRITLNQSFLNGAEVRVRQDGGQIVVELTSPNPESQSFLRERGNDLQQALQDRLGGEVRVEIRSQDAGRDPQDGRSRQHRSVQDEWEAER